MPDRPLLIVNPRDDPSFAGTVQALVDGGVSTSDELQRRLREAYPLATVRPRDLSSERTAMWYVYREGHWVPSAERRNEPDDGHG